MKKLLLVLICFFSFQICHAQFQEHFLQTWYLDYFAYDGGDFHVSSLGITDIPNFTVTENFIIIGTSFCNEFSGTFEYEDAGVFTTNDVFRPTNIVRGTQNCGGLEPYETQFYIPFIAEAPADIITLTEDLLILQFFNPTTYQAYRNSPELSTTENKLINITISPNPTSEILNINNLSAHIDTAYLYAMNGTLVKSYSTIDNQLNISEVPAGIYFLRITQDGATTVKRIVKE